ncbi:MAG: zinc ABC transporter substrate-binding protein [Campylobacteraceae bacterium]|nr:zinc ABC transporter substrate-binding protein [Campylobacteraceae bacterium]
MKKIILVLSFCFIGLFADDFKVTVSILPQKYFVEQIAGDKVNVNVMVRPGFSPATYEPQTSQMKLLSESQVYFSIGVPFEKAWLEKFENANKKMLVVDTNKGITKLEMSEHDHHEEEHEEEKDNHKEDEHQEEEDHHEDGFDPHVWLDPLLVKIQAKNIYDTLVQMDRKNKVFYTKNYLDFLRQLDVLNTKIKSKLKSVSKSAFMVFHPSWGYFAKRYDLEQIVVEKEGKEPKPKEIIELIKESKEHQIKVVFVAPQFSQKAAQTIARSIKGRVVNIDHLAYDYPKGLINTAQAIYDSYK